MFTFYAKYNERTGRMVELVERRYHESIGYFSDNLISSFSIMVNFCMYDNH